MIVNKKEKVKVKLSKSENEKIVYKNKIFLKNFKNRFWKRFSKINHIFRNLNLSKNGLKWVSDIKNVKSITRGV